MEKSIARERAEHPELLNEKIIDLDDKAEEDEALFDTEDMDESSYDPKKEKARKKAGVKDAGEAIVCCDNEECECDSDDLSSEHEVDASHIQLAKVLDKFARLSHNRASKVCKEERLKILTEACADCFHKLSIHPSERRRQPREIIESEDESDKSKSK